MGLKLYKKVKKLFNNYFILKYLADFLNNEIKDRIIIDIFSQEKNKLVISLKKNISTDDIKFLEFSCEKGSTYLVLREIFYKAKRNYAQLFEYLYGSSIDSVMLYKYDRVISIKLNNKYNLNFFFITGKQNLIIDSGEIIHDSFKLSDDLKNNTLDSLLERKTKQTNEKEVVTIQDYIKSHYYHYGPIILEEVLYNLNLNGNEILTLDIKSEIDKEFNIILHSIENPSFILYKVKTEYIPSLVKLNSLNEYEYIEYSNINSMLAEYISHYIRNKKTEEIKKDVLKTIEKKEKSLISKIQSIKKQIENNQDFGHFLEYGNIIICNKEFIDKGQQLFVYNNYKIPLDKKLNAVQNANKYFDKYKKAKKNIDDLKNKLIKFEKMLDELLNEKDKILNITDYKIIKEMNTGIVKDKENPDLKLFRIFKFDENFEVWVGKNSLANDLLTTKYSSQNDLWFHIRDYPGSHTVLKKKNKKLDFPKSYISRAASIAAYYSKAKNAGNVAVAYCERKYIKKRKGMKEGTVIMQKEKVIYVRPEIPEEI